MIILMNSKFNKFSELHIFHWINYNCLGITAGNSSLFIKANLSSTKNGKKRDHNKILHFRVLFVIYSISLIPNLMYLHIKKSQKNNRL